MFQPLFHENTKLNLAEAACDGHWTRVEQLVERGDDVNVVDSFTCRRTALHFAAERGRKASCELLLKSGENICATDENGDQPLHCAARNDKAAVCELLVAHGADVAAVNKKGQTPLISAAAGADDLWRWLFGSSTATCHLLLTNEIVNVADCDGNYPLHMACACSRSNIATVQLLMDHGAGINAVNKYGQTPLHTAAGGDDDRPDLCKLLVKHGTKIHAVDEDGNQPLQLACHQDHIETLKFLVSQGADANAVNKHGQTPLHAAAGGKKDCPHLCKLLVKHGTKIGAVDKDGNQPLHVACKRSFTETVKLMVCHGADTTTMNKHGQTPLHTAAGGWKDCPELCDILLKHDAKTGAVDEDGNQPLHLPCQQCYTETVQVMVSHGADTNAVNKHGQTPLHIIVSSGKKDCCAVCEILLRHGAKTNEGDEDENQPLHLMCEAGQTLTVKALLGYNANVSARNNHGQTCLHKMASSRRDCPELCLLLIGMGAEVNAVDGNGDISLQIALQKGNIKTSEVLLANGADGKVLTRCGETVLHLLCKGVVDSHELCEELIACGVNPHLADREGNLPLHIALNNKLPKTSYLLCKQLGSSTLDDLWKMNIQSKDINCLLWFAVDICDAGSCHKLLDLGADPNSLNHINQLPNLNLHSSARVCPLHIAVYNNSLELCCLLLDHGATVNVSMLTDKSASALDQAQPLHLAAKLGYIDVCHVLLEQGADVNAEMKKRKTPLYLAIVGNRDDIVQLLLTYGAIADNVKIRVPALERSATSGSRSVVSLLHDSGERHYSMFLTQLTLFSL